MRHIFLLLLLLSAIFTADSIWSEGFNPFAYFEIENPITKFINKKKCYQDLGCFAPYDSFHILHQPLTFTPFSPEELDVTFNLFTQRNLYRPTELKYNTDVDQILAAGYDGAKKTKILIHGYRDSYDDMAWMGNIKDFILEQGFAKYNVIGVDWRRGANVNNYLQAVANTRVVGAMVAHLIQRLVNATEGNNYNKFHLIGHSLGAQTSGFAGARIKLLTNKTIARISALDPAGPGFQDNRPESRLDPTDAGLVLVYHTNAGNHIMEGFGIDAPLGHYDFYPNGGMSQPGCELATGISNFLLKGGEGKK